MGWTIDYIHIAELVAAEFVVSVVMVNYEVSFLQIYSLSQAAFYGCG